MSHGDGPRVREERSHRDENDAVHPLSLVDFVIVADDLTGAADSGVQFARNGHRTAVFFQGEEVEPEGLDVVVVDTDSRAMDEDEARRSVTETGTPVAGVEVVFKKIDSTLRGNIAAEIDTLMQATSREYAVVAPAFPSGGRTTVEGTQLVHGVPVHETGLARDPKTPVEEGHLPTLLSGIVPLARLGVRDLENPAKVRDVMARNRCVVVDATEDGHLTALVRALPDPSAGLWVGSAGLAGALASVYPGRDPAELPAFSCERVLVVVGSLNEVSHAQLGELAGRGLATPVTVSGACSEEAVSEALAALEDGRNVALHSPESAGELSPVEVTEMLAGTVFRLRGHFDALVLTGGDTAVGVARRLGATGMEVFGEVEAGVPFGKLTGGLGLPVITKAGGFGGPATLCKAVDFLTTETEAG